MRLVLSGNSGDSLAVHRGMPFTTKDQDNDNYGSHNCAIKYKGAWWYERCHSSNLNGLYLSGSHPSDSDGVNWYDWKGYHYSLKRTEMKIRPVDFWTVMFMAQQWYYNETPNNYPMFWLWRTLSEKQIFQVLVYTGMQ